MAGIFLDKIKLKTLLRIQNNDGEKAPNGMDEIFFSTLFLEDKKHLPVSAK